MYEETFGGEAPSNTAVSTQVVDDQESSAALSTHVDDGSDNFDLSDMYVPRLNICQPTSSDVEGNSGDIVIDKIFPAYAADTKAPLFILSVKKAWKEDVPYESTDIPRFANTAAEASALTQILAKEGPSLIAKGEKPRKVIHFGEVILFLQHTPESLIQGDEVADVFPFKIGAHDYALVKATFQKTSYDGTIRRIMNVRTANPTLDLSSVPFTISTSEKRAGKNRWFTPTMLPKVTEKAPTELVEFITNLKGGAR